ncbi:MAG: hypothetical protein L3V56_14735 [Candidatus Magnetoovum sp. WYHC-5]|nr:hypothetical protein [Candidatus Magnetoovum sp. WYHC-5]
MVTIKVVDKSSGKPVEGKKVFIIFDGLFRGSTDYQYTDSIGEVYFNNDPGNGKVSVGHSTVYRGDIRGRVVVYI